MGPDWELTNAQGLSVDITDQGISINLVLHKQANVQIQDSDGCCMTRMCGNGYNVCLRALTTYEEAVHNFHQFPLLVVQHPQKYIGAINVN
jgi:hypothetical protein